MSAADGTLVADAPGAEREFNVPYVTRVEGEGSLVLRVRDREVVEARLKIFEAPRYFERIVVGRTGDEVIDIVARICGICPIAYQMTAVHAFEDLYGVEVHPAIRSLRRLLYCGEYIQSHALHVYLLHAPDYLGYPSALAMAADHRAVVEQGLAIKKIGNQLISALGGRPVHPISVRVGGILPRAVATGPRSRPPGARRRRRLVTGNREPRRLVGSAGLRAPPAARGAAASGRVSLQRRPDRLLGRAGHRARGLGRRIRGASPRGLQRAARAHARRGRLPAWADRTGWPRGRPAPPVGGERRSRQPVSGTPSAPTSTARSWPVPSSCSMPARKRATSSMPTGRRASRVSRSPLGRGSPPGPRRLPGASSITGTRWTGRATWSHAQIVPPTSQNQGAIEADLAAFAPSVLDLPQVEAVHRLEMLIRAYDPCISCATHFLDLRIVEDGA